MNGVKYRVFSFFLQEVFKNFNIFMFYYKLLSNIVHVPVNNGIYKFAKLLFDLACRLAMATYTIMYLNIFHSLTITIAPYQSHSNHKHKTFLAMNKYSSKLRHALDSLKIKKIKILSSRRRPCCHAKLKYNRLLLMKKGSNHCTGKLEMKYL